MAKTCFPGNKLMFKVTTGQSSSISSIDLKFQFLVYPNCPGIPKDVIMESDKGRKNQQRSPPPTPNPGSTFFEFMEDLCIEVWKTL